MQQTGPEKYKCMDTIGILAFMNNKDVRAEMHVIEIEPDLVWDLCNLDILRSFKRDHDGALKIYEKLLREEHNLRIVTFILLSGLFLGLRAQPSPSQALESGLKSLR